MEPKEFERLLIDEPSLEIYLNEDPRPIPHGMHWPGEYTFLLEQSYRHSGGIINAQGAVGDYLKRRNVSFECDDKYAKLYSLILKAQPKWLDLDSRYVEKEILSQAGDRTGNELLLWLKAEILKRFRYEKKPPKWCRNPEWPIGANGPLIFVGQFPLTEYTDNPSAVYVFFDHTKWTTETIVQIGD